MPGEDLPVIVGGMQPMTTLDFEGHISAVLFLQGCPYNCRYCHNPDLIPTQCEDPLDTAEIMEMLKKRQGFLDAVVFSGGEPTLQDGLGEAAARIADLGYDIALHTNGFSPSRLHGLLESGAIDYVAMDVKAPFDTYESITRVSGSGQNTRDSIEVLVKSGVAHEFRTTWHPALVSEDDLLDIARYVADAGADAYYVQEFRTEGCRDEELNFSPLIPVTFPDDLRHTLDGMFPTFGLRGDF